MRHPIFIACNIHASLAVLMPHLCLFLCLNFVIAIVYISLFIISRFFLFIIKTQKLYSQKISNNTTLILQNTHDFNMPQNTTLMSPERTTLILHNTYDFNMPRHNTFMFPKHTAFIFPQNMTLMSPKHATSIFAKTILDLYKYRQFFSM